MTMPNFFIIGAQRCGTSSLYRCLKQHPQIFMSPAKEPRFFLFNGEEPDFTNIDNPEDAEARYQAIHNISITNITEYCAQFEGVNDEKAIGEASVHYLYSPRVPKRILKNINNAKIIAILRDPVERAYSNYFLDLSFGTKLPFYDFARLAETESKYIGNIWEGAIHYIRKGFYYSQLKYYYDSYSSDQIKVYLYEDLKNNPDKMYQDIFRFLEVDESFKPDTSTKYNVSYSYKKNSLYNLATFLFQRQKIMAALTRLILSKRFHKRIETHLSHNNKNFNKPPILPEVRTELIKVFKEDILNLQDLIQRDLSSWLKV